jgi:hypothetical protein
MLLMAGRHRGRVNGAPRSPILPTPADKENNRYGWPDCDVSRLQHSNRGSTAETVVNPALFYLIGSTFPMQNGRK